MIDSTLKNANILVVDDQIANIDILEGFLIMQGYTNIKTTTDPREVLTLISDFKPDLILLDLSMPFMTGFEVMDALKKQMPTSIYLPILVLTADVANESKIKALSAGASDFLTKPFDLIEVGLRIRNLLFTNYLQQQLWQQNQQLEAKVKERTFELEKTNKELLISKEKAEASDYLKTAFILNISHEVRTPLNGILGFAELLASPDIDVEQKQMFLPMIQLSSNRLLNTITEYMDMSLIVSDNMVATFKPVNLTDILGDIKTKFLPQCHAKKLNLEFQVTPEYNDFTFITDPVLFEKLLSHLFDNAIKFTETGSVTFGMELKNLRVEFYIKDSGIGISHEAHDQVFKMFNQVDNSLTRGYDGSGLGLSIVKGILKILGGRIHLESELDKGSTFYISLPYDRELLEESPMEKPLQIQPTKNIPVILVAEDDYANFAFIEALLEEHPIKILHAKNGREAVDFCRDNKDISVVLMDIKMPILDGLEATKQIKSFRKELPIVAITAFAMSGDETKVYEAGCDDYLTKPVSSDKILEKIRGFGLTI